jgi:hypothetical protein
MLTNTNYLLLHIALGIQFGSMLGIFAPTSPHENWTTNAMDPFQLSRKWAKIPISLSLPPQ